MLTRRLMLLLLGGGGLLSRDEITSECGGGIHSGRHHQRSATVRFVVVRIRR
jgi:hypothetical protein